MDKFGSFLGGVVLGVVGLGLVAWLASDDDSSPEIEDDEASDAREVEA